MPPDLASPEPSRREQIEQVACRLFSKQGYHATTMRHLAGELGLQPGSLYSHIASKEELLVSIVAGVAEQFAASLLPLQDAPLPADVTLREALRRHMAVLRDNRLSAKVFLYEWEHLGPEDRAQVTVWRDQIEDLYRGILARGVEDGTFREDLDVKLSVNMILGSLNWSHTWYRPQGRLSPQGVADEFADTLLSGMRRGGG